MKEIFDYDSFHMGADEVHFGCWNSTERIVKRMKEQFDFKNDEKGNPLII